jgi:hypothetical protein
MREQQRDFYRIQDQLKMAWRPAADHVVSEVDDALIELNQELDEELQSLAQINPGIASVLTLLNRKIQLAMGDTATSLSASFGEAKLTDVSISGSGMGFLCEEAPEDGLLIDLFLDLDSIHIEIVIRMVVLESRASADTENPGFWVRGRFDEDQDTQVDTIVAHVNQRQYEQLQRRTNQAE